MTGSTVEGVGGLKVKIGQRIGSGAFGVVYSGTSGRSKQISYAVKVIAPVTDPDVRLSFENEIRGVEKLKHDNLLLPLDHGECDVHGEKGFYVVYPFCADGSYRERLAGRSMPTTSEEFKVIIDEVEQILEGLYTLHTKTVHRDLKPENILVDGDKLLIGDFGLTKFVADATRTLTFKGSGTPLYMAPEVWSMQHIGIPADLYAIGVMMFEAMVGARPFEGGAHELQNHHMYTPAPRARSMNPNIPVAIDGIIKKLLHKDAGQRFQSAREVLDALRAPVAAVPINAAIFVESMQRHHDAEERQRLEAERASKLKSDKAARNAYMEQEALDMFTEAVAGINALTPDAQIKQGHSRSNEKSYSFANRQLEIGFYSSGSFPKEDPRGSRYGYAEHLHKENVVHGGHVSVSENGQLRIGWNLVLKRPPEGGYGQWYFVTVEFSAFTNKRYINGTMPVDAETLTDAYGQHIGHVMGIYNVRAKPFTSEDVQTMLSYLMPSSKLNGTEEEERRKRGRSDFSRFDTTY